MEICDRVEAPTGILRYDVFRGGRLLESCCEKNLIVAGSKGLLAGLLGGDVANKSVTKIGFGTNGAAPSSGNTALTGAFLKTLGAPSYPAGAVTFPFVLEAADANGLAIIEFGLLTADNTLFSRRVRSTAINKAADISFVGSWTISF